MFVIEIMEVMKWTTTSLLQNLVGHAVQGMNDHVVLDFVFCILPTHWLFVRLKGEVKLRKKAKVTWIPL